MEFVRQIILVLSEPPGSFVYHLVTLFALQVVFAISYARWRRQPDDDYARNMSLAAGIIFAGRLFLLAAGLYYRQDPAAAAGVLPPLEQAVNSASVALMIWALVPRSERYPRLFDTLLVSTLILTGVMYLFFAQEWFDLAASGQAAYHGSPQSSIWSLFQITMLALGFGFLLFRGRSLGALPPIILAIMLVFHIIQLWNYPEFVRTETNVAYWVRLGNLIAIPLWAVYAYIHAMTPLLSFETRLQEAVARFGGSMEDAAQVIATQQSQRRLAYSLEMLNKTYETADAAIGLLDGEDPTTVTFFGLAPAVGPGELRSWTMNLAENVALSAAQSQGQTSELLRNGLGSRQLYAYFKAAALAPTASLLIHPLAVNGSKLGFLVLPLADTREQWTMEEVALVPGMAHFIAQALQNSQIPDQQALAEPELDPPPVTTAVPAAIVMDRARLQDLQHQVEELRVALSEAEEKRRYAEANATAAQKQARYLAAALRAVQSVPDEDVVPSPDEDISPSVAREG